VVPTDSVEVLAAVLNITVVGPTAAGFLTVRPSDATGTPVTSNLNFLAGQLIANSATVQLGIAAADLGKIEIIYSAFGASGPTTHVLVDVVGYYFRPAGSP
jgi:serine protease